MKLRYLIARRKILLQQLYDIDTNIARQSDKPTIFQIVATLDDGKIHRMRDIAVALGLNIHVVATNITSKYGRGFFTRTTRGHYQLSPAGRDYLKNHPSNNNGEVQL